MTERVWVEDEDLMLTSHKRVLKRGVPRYLVYATGMGHSYVAGQYKEKRYYKYSRLKWGYKKAKAQRYKTENGALKYIDSIKDLIRSNDQDVHIKFKLEVVYEV
jgi:hypothetical protein